MLCLWQTLAPRSKGFDVGQAIARGQKPKDIVAGQKTVVEGYGATTCFYDKSTQSGASAPVLEQVYQILYKGMDPMTAVVQLMGRDLKAEGPA